MCGLAGILYRDPLRRVDAANLDRMTDAIAHRGPDDRGIWIDGAIGLGHRRLAIRDLSRAGRQPMHDAGGRVTVVFNGEIYNDGALRRELERDHGARLHSTCDAEILPAAFVAWGGAMFERLEGMFAIAVWDRRDRTLWLARDAAGIKPLYVSDDGAVVRFGSELKAVLADPTQRRRLALPAVHRFLAQGYTGPDSSLLDGIGQVAPGTVWRIGRDGVERRAFWRPTRTSEIRDLPTALAAFTETWEPVLESMLPSDVPLGLLLSGGIDSALIALSVGRAHPLPMFTAGFAEASHSETGLAAQTAAVLGRAPTVVPVDVEGDAGATLERVVHHLDGQLADSSAFAVYTLSREVRRHVTVVLSGDGADELFGGYPTYRASRFAALVQPVMPRAAAARLAELVGRLGARSETRLAASAVAARFLWGSPPGAARVTPTGGGSCRRT